MENYKVTLISTVMDEEKNIEQYMQSIFLQSRLPDEIVIVDGGSKDKTVNVIKNFCNRDIDLKVIIKKGVNIAQGRNIAISSATGNIIVATDAGCDLDIDWIKNITKPFIEDFKNTDVVAGYYKGNPQSFFEKCVSEFTLPKISEFNKYNPSSRSVAFKKSAWKSVGGYPEWLYTGEDSLFNIRLKEANFKFKFASDAVVFWRPRENVIKLFKQFYLYAIGDRRANLIKGHYVEKLNKYLMFFIILFTGYRNLIIWIIIIYLIWSYWSTRIKRVYGKLEHKMVYFYIPIIITTMDLAKIFGFLIGYLYYINDKYGRDQGEKDEI